MRYLKATGIPVLGLLTVWMIIASAAVRAADAACQVKPVSAEQAAEYKLDAGFYKKCTLVQNILIATKEDRPTFLFAEEQGLEITLLNPASGLYRKLLGMRVGESLEDPALLVTEVMVCGNHLAVIGRRRYLQTRWNSILKMNSPTAPIRS